MIMDQYHEVAYGYGIHDIYDDEMTWEKWFYYDGYVVLRVFMDEPR